jgi:hypothetical protein
VHELRERVGRFLREQFGSAPTDAVGDFMVGIGDAAVWVRPELWTGGRTIVRVWSITNVGMRADAELGRFLLEANARLPFGGLRLDEARPAVVFADALLGDYLNRPELSVTVAAAAATTSELAPGIKQRFGGHLFTEL